MQHVEVLLLTHVRVQRSSKYAELPSSQKRHVFQYFRQAPELFPWITKEKNIARIEVPNCDPFATVVKVKHEYTMPVL